MRTKVAVSELEVCNALSTLISKNPFKQVEWVESALKDPDIVGKIQWFGSMKGYETPYREAGLFMLVYITVEGFKRKISEIQFFETVKEIEDELMVDVMPEHFTWYEFHLFYYKKENGYVEIPFSVGEYVPFKGCLCQHIEDNGCAPNPDKFYFENNIEPDDAAMGEYNRDFFFEVPELFELSYQGFSCEEYNQWVIEYFFFKDLKNAFKFTVDKLIKFYLESRVLSPYNKCNKVTLADRWYNHEVYINEDKLEDMSEEMGFSTDTLPFEFIEECIEVVSSIKFAEKERGWDYEDTSDC